MRLLSHNKSTRSSVFGLNARVCSGVILICAAFLFISLSPLPVSAQPELFRDTENCLLCHRYPTIGRYSVAGDKRIYYINEQEFAKTVHGRVVCSDCHAGLDKIPHPEGQKVDCSATCHITDPATGKKFSHIDMTREYESSVHGQSDVNVVQIFPGDLPKCVDCHDNHIYHSDDDVRQRRNQQDIVRLCTRCHKDREIMARHGLEPIDTFKDSFHWELAKYGVRDAPDCISCHVPVGHSSHEITPGSDPISPINAANRVKTCSNIGGTQTCHPDATEKFASGRVHAYQLKAQLETGKSMFDVEGRFKILMGERTRANIPKEEIFNYKILYLLKLFYKALIALVIGFMTLHQVLDYIRYKKKHKTSR